MAAAKPGSYPAATMDGTMIYIREEGWKELKVGCVFEIEVRPTRDQETGEWVDLAHAVHNTYVTPDGKYALSGSRDMTLKLWELASGNCIRTFTGQSIDLLERQEFRERRPCPGHGLRGQFRRVEMSSRLRSRTGKGRRPCRAGLPRLRKTGDIQK